MTTLADLQTLMRTHGPNVLARGGGTKPALSTPHEDHVLADLSGWRGVEEYDPSEYTITLRAGTPLADVIPLLQENGQYLPFDPPLVAAGATVGGTVATGLSGPGRYRFGGVRDFILGVRYLNARGTLIRGGGKVVKNAAGFDLPKLMVGALGRLGLLTEVTFKVFPRPQATTTLVMRCPRLEDALNAVYRLTASPLELEALDFAGPESGGLLWARLGGLPEALPRRFDRLRQFLGGGEQLPEEADFWSRARELSWFPPSFALIKVPLTPRRIPAFHAALTANALCRFSGGGQVAWLATPDPLDTLDASLTQQGLGGLTLFGPVGRSYLGHRPGWHAIERLYAAMMPPTPPAN